MRKKKWIGAAISAVGTIANAFINSANKRKQAEEQIREQRLNKNIENTNTYINNLNQLANTNNDWAYDKFRPTFKCGGKRRMKASLGKYKSRFGK